MSIALRPGQRVTITDNVMYGKTGPGITLPRRPSGGMDEAWLRRRIAQEQHRGQIQVEALLDQLCRNVGLNPWEAWRKPRHLRRMESLEATTRQLRADLARVRRANRPRDARGRWTR